MTMSYNNLYIEHRPSGGLFTAWSDNGGAWRGQMAQGSEALQNVQWIEML